MCGSRAVSEAVILKPDYYCSCVYVRIMPLISPLQGSSNSLLHVSVKDAWLGTAESVLSSLAAPLVDCHLT